MIKFSLIICTYQRSKALLKLLKSIEQQSVYPNQIIIVDGSINEETKVVIAENSIKNLEYYLVSNKDRGLTKQRNFGIAKVKKQNVITCFLDDDVVLLEDYFEQLIGTYIEYPDIVGVGGYILDEKIRWSKVVNNKIDFKEFKFDGWKRKLGTRNVLRKRLNLLSDLPPGFMPEFSHGFSIGFLPPSGENYPVEFFMGCAMSFKTSILRELMFSEYFEGYGLYEDMDFCLRLSKMGSLYVNTSAKLYHYHEASGRPNQFKYGKMVSQNGAYVWKVKYPNPDFSAKLNYYKISLLLAFIRLCNVLNTSKKKEAFTEAFGRFYGIIFSNK
ncbi:MAG: glycosyl transferase family 2 [Zunongwangia sp.]|uniref:glycosyltransferase family 2 protein n=1 Tax=Zunongwangia profunda TaxID=398743 RepID=UPI000C8E29D9|nr:glycosyltransferase [Zunongwangia profunda]MAG88407.1 glycosyl transferase family 2 [Flavobacteriaceae bacterium]MAO35686.1 glycosyl transferase family 2 [Zunongwangia sp.]MCC4230183.1 glycosyltransferase [Zunongwangia profunda]|tara:strand:+ start:28362 stop:29345 length:984 start_codon:yes stop_codon:yes gene_type:complete